MKALFLSFSTSFNASGIHETSPFASDVRAAMHLFSNLSYEIFVHNPYRLKSKQNLFVEHYGENNVLTTEEVLERLDEFDCCVTRFNQVLVNKITGKVSFKVDTLIPAIAKRCESYSGRIYNLSADYRAPVIPPDLSVMKMLTPKNQERMDSVAVNSIINLLKTKTLVTLCSSSTNVPAELKDYKNLALSNFMDYTPWSIHGKPVPLSPEFEYDYLYGGVSKLNKYRKRRVLLLTDKMSSKATVGKTIIPHWPNLTNNKFVNDAEYQILMSKAKLNIVFAEPWHDFLTPRFTESLIKGSIFAVDESYTKGCKVAEQIGLGDRILKDSTDALCLLQRNAKELYDDQLRAHTKLIELLPKPILTHVV